MAGIAAYVSYQHAFEVVRAHGESGPPVRTGGGEDEVDTAAVAAYRASLESGTPLSERKLAAMFGKTSCRWARSRMAEARHAVAGAI